MVWKGAVHLRAGWVAGDGQAVGGESVGQPGAQDVAGMGLLGEPF